MKRDDQISPDLNSVLPIVDQETAFSEAVAGSLEEARTFLAFYDWGRTISAEYVGAHFNDILSIFLFQIEHSREDVDDWVWVLVGDIPPAYITCEDAKNPYEALDGYIGAMEEWVHAARNGTSVAEMIPVNVPATPDNATLLNDRLRLLDEQVLPLLAGRSATN